MFSGKIWKMISVVVLALALSLGGCITMPDGSSEPDYVLIEFGSVAAFTVIVNETEVPDESVVRAYEGLSALEVTLQSVLENGGDLDLSILDKMLANAVPFEYKALAETGSKLIRSRVKQYVDLPENPLPESELVAKVALSVVQGAKAALGPKYSMINK